MRNATIFKLLTLLLLSLIMNNVFSQGNLIEVTIKAPQKVYTCQRNNFEAVFFIDANKSFTIKPYIDNTSISCPSTSSNGIFMIIDSVVGGNLISAHYNDSLNFELQNATPNDSIHLFYSIVIDCSIIKDSSTIDSTFNLFQEWTTLTDSIKFQGSFPSNTYKSSNIQFVFFNESPITLNSIGYLETKYVEFIFKNTGNGNGEISFSFEPDTANFCNGAIIPDSIWFKQGLNKPYFSYQLGSSSSIFINSKDSLIFKLKLKNFSCLDDCKLTSIFNWSCKKDTVNFQPIPFCDSCQSALNAIVLLPNAASPKLRIVKDKGPDVTDFSCANDTIGMPLWRYVIKTDGFGKLDSAVISLREQLGTNFNLTQIPINSIKTYTYCSECDTIQIIAIKPSNYLCAGYITDALDSLQFRIHNFGVNDSLILEFKTFRCASNEPLLYNQPKIFNTWSFANSYAIGICDTVKKLAFVNPLYIRNAIELNITAVIDPFVIFTPQVSDLSVPPDSLFGDSTLMEIEIKNLANQGSVNWPIFGSTGLPNDILQGTLRVSVNAQKGIRIKTPATGAYFSYDSSGITIVLQPDYFYTSIADGVCDTGNFVFYFNLNHPSSKRIFNNSKFNFMLTACCGGNNGRSDFDVKFDLLMNPDTCNQLDYSNSLHDSPAPCTGFGCEWLPLTLVAGGITPHCPGCITPGIVVSAYRMERKTFGLQDSDNNGKADNGALTITQNSTWYDANKSKLKLNNSQFGDLVEDYLVAYFSPGDAGSGGYNYNQMLADSVQLPYLQLSRTISVALDTMNLIPDSMYIYIDSPADSIRIDSCNDCALFNVNPLKFETQLELHIDATHLQDFLKLDYTNNNYLYTLVSADTLGILSGNLHNTVPYYQSTSFPFVGYFEKQQYRIRVFYSTLGNFKVPKNIINPAIKDVQKKSEIRNKMWLTQSPKVANAFSIYPAQPSSLASLQNEYQYTIYPDTINLLPHIDSAFIDSFLFICESFDGLHYFYSEDGRNLSNVSFTDSCNRLINVQALIRTAGDLLDIYPYEYKTSALRFNKYVVNVPPNFELVSIAATNSVNYNSSKKFSNEIKLGSNQFVKNQNQYIVYDSTLIQKGCLEEIDNPLNDTMFYGDSSTFRIFKFNIKPIGCDSTFFGNPDSLVEVFFNTRNKLCNPVVGLAANFQDSIVKDGDTTTVFKLENNLQIQPPLIPIIANSNQLCFDVVYTNPVNPSLTFTGGVPYLYLAFKKDAVSDLFSNWTAQINGGSTFSFTNLMVEVDSLLSRNGIDSLTICANFNTCLDSNQIDFTPLQFYSGWNCSNFPDSPFSVDSVCNFKIDTVRIQPSQTAMAASIIEPEVYSLCEADTIFATFSSLKDGLIYPTAISLSNIQTGVTINSVNIGNPDSSVFIPISYDSTLQNYTIAGADLVSIGYVDSSFNDTIDFSIAIIVTPTCGFNSSNFLDFNLTALNYCGDTVKYTANRRVTSLSWSGLSFCDTCFTLSKTASTDTVNINSPIAYTITITSNNADSSLVMFNELFPSGFTLVSQSPAPTFAPNIYAVPAQGAISIVISGNFSNPALCDSNINFVTIKHLAPDSALFSAQACVEVVEPCIDINTLVFPDKYAISTLVASLPSSYLKNKKCYIVGELNIDMDFKFEDCKLIMAPGSVINILRDADLTLDSTSVVGCDSMWQGIFLEATSNVFVLRSSCINDADIAIKGNDGADIICLNSSLQNNIHGIYFPVSNSSSYFNDITVAACNFGLNATQFKPDYSGQAIHGSLPYAGIEFYNNRGVQEIGELGFSLNTFENLNYGIVAINTNVNISNSIFTNILDSAYSFNSSKINGTAMVSIGDAVTKRNGTINVNTSRGPVIVNYAKRGIYTSYSDVFVSNCLFDTVFVGIEGTKTIDRLRSIISNNTINASGIGINWYANSGARIMDAYRNTIHIYKPGRGVGIRLMEASNQNPTNYLVYLDNQITMNGNSYGIEATNINRPLIGFNNIRMNYGATPISQRGDGISIKGCDKAIVCLNTVTGALNIDTSKYAIASYISSNSNIYCNTTDSTGFGFYFASINPGTSFKGNNMFNHFDGLRLNNVAVIDSQAHAGNRWLGNYASGFGAVNFNANSPFTLAQSLFTVDPAFQFGNPTIPNLSGTYAFLDNNGWFKPLGGTTYTCSGLDINDLVANSNYGSDELREAIANDQQLTSEFVEESKKIADEYLARYLAEHPDEAAYNTLYNQFLTNNAAQVDLNLAQNYLSKIYTFDETTAANIDSIKFLIESLNDSLRRIDSLNEISPIFNVDVLKLQLINAITIAENYSSTLLIQQRILREADFIQAQIANGGVITTELPELNTQFINQIEQQYEEYGISALIAMNPAIEVMARQCPYQGGTAVYRARYFVSLVNDSIDYDDENVCLTAGIWRKAGEKNTVKTDFLIVPNPASSTITIRLNNTLNVPIKLTILGADGKIVVSKIIEGSGLELLVTNLSFESGIYQVRIQFKDSTFLTKKLVILK